MCLLISWAELIQVIHFSLKGHVYGRAQLILFERRMYNDVLSKSVCFKDVSQVSRSLHKGDKHIIFSNIKQFTVLIAKQHIDVLKYRFHLLNQTGISEHHKS
jgi:polyphosphate kinase 2 (PPK2 family)